MPKIPSHGWKDAAKVLKSLGFVAVRQKGSHIVFEKEGIARPIILPTYDDLDKRIIRTILKTGMIDQNQYIRLLTGELKKH